MGMGMWGISLWTAARGAVVGSRQQQFGPLLPTAQSFLPQAGSEYREGEPQFEVPARNAAVRHRVRPASSATISAAASET